MNIKLLLPLVSILFFASCQDETDCCVQILPIDGSINLSSLEVGQKSKYLRYKSSCADLNGDFEYTGDILMLEVVEVDGVMMLQESLTEDSPLYKDGSFTVEILYPVSSEDGVMTIPQRAGSVLFYFYGSDYIKLNPDHDVVLKQDACRLIQDENPFIGNDIGVLPNFDIGPLNQKDKTAVSCVPSIWNLEAYLIYDSNRLYMSHVITNSNFQDMIEGWVISEN